MAFNPIDLIKRGTSGLIEQGKDFFNAAKDINQKVIDFKPKVSEFLAPKGQFEQKEIDVSKPTFKEQLLAGPKKAVEIGTGLYRLNKLVGQKVKLPKPTGVIDIPNIVTKGYLNKKMGEVGETVVQKLEKFQQPTTPGAQKLSQQLDIAGLFTVGSTKNIASVSRKLAPIQDANVLRKELKAFGLADDAIEEYLPTFVKETDPKAFSQALSEAVIPKPLRQKGIELEIRRQAVEESPFNRTRLVNSFDKKTGELTKRTDNDLRFLFTREGNVKELGNLKNVNDIRRYERIMAETGFEDPTEFADALEKYQINKKKLIEEEKLFKTDVARIKNAPEFKAQPKVSETQSLVQTAEAIPETQLQQRVQGVPEFSPEEIKNLVDQGLSENEAVKRLETFNKYKALADEEIKTPARAKQSYTESERLYREITDMESFPAQRADIDTISVETNLGAKAPEYKDIGNISKGLKDVYRIFEDVFDPDTYKVMKKKVLDPLDESKGKFIDMQNRYLTDLQNTIVKKYGIKRKTKESALLQRFGEKSMTYDELVKEVGSKMADNIVLADKWFRKTYDELIDEVNKVRIKIYPTRPEKIIPKRADYYRHFKEMQEGFQGLKNVFETPAGIDPKLAGLSPYTKPQTKFMPAAQRRLGVLTEEDAVGGFLDYLPSAAYSIHIDPNIGNFRALANKVADVAPQGNLNNFKEFLTLYANSLAGKTNEIDRLVSSFIPGGRKTVATLNWANRRVKLNTILFNIGSALAQPANIVQGIASAKKYSALGALKSFRTALKPSPEMLKSNFMKERFFKSYDQFNTSMLDNAKKMASWLITVGDEITGKFIWNSHYEKAKALGSANPIKYADDMTRKLIGGRGIGEVPLAQQSQVFQMVAPFQLEVTNLWWVMKDFVKEKDFGAFLILFTSAYMFNRVAEDVRGNPVVFDPINAVIEGYGAFKDASTPGEGLLRMAGRFGGEVLSNLPLGQTIASIYDENGGGFLGGAVETIAGTKLTSKELFGSQDPTRYGSGLLVMKGLQDPLYKILPPFGGSQIKKTKEGIQALMEKGVFNKGDQLLYEQPTTLPKALQTIAFGKYSTKEAREYFDTQAGKPKPIEKTYREVQKLKEQGKIEDAEAIVKGLTDAEYEEYKTVKANEKRKVTNELKREIMPVYKEVQKLKAQGKEDEALSLVKTLSDDEYRAYKLIKEQLSK